MKLSNRVAALTPSSTLAITAKAKQLKEEGRDVIGLGAGEPDFNTPQHIIDAAIKSMQEGKTKYTAAGGLLQLKEAIIEKLKQDQGLKYEPSEIIVSSGAKHSLYTLFQALLDEGDEVIIPSPYWVSYPEQVKLADGTPVIVEGKEEDDFKVTPAQLQQVLTSRTKAVIINSPSNPTCTSAPPQRRSTQETQRAPPPATSTDKPGTRAPAQTLAQTNARRWRSQPPALSSTISTGPMRRP